MIRQLLARLFAPRWEYGKVPAMEGHHHETDPARRHRKTGEVQFILWEAGEQGHIEPYWHPMNSYWWPYFVPDSTPNPERK